jgi:hypothetical protein
LPGEVRRSRALDASTKLLVGHGDQGPRHVAGQRLRGRDGPSDASLGRAIDRRQSPHPEPQVAHFDAPLLEACDDFGAEERELVRPNARRHSEHEDPLMEGYGLRSLRDARPYCVPPQAEGQGRACTGESTLAGALENRHEGLGGGLSVTPARGCLTPTAVARSETFRLSSALGHGPSFYLETHPVSPVGRLC